LIEVIRSSGEEMWRIDAYQIPYYSRGIEGEKRTHPRFADWHEIWRDTYFDVIEEWRQRYGKWHLEIRKIENKRQKYI
jgi:hypothetical protein